MISSPNFSSRNGSTVRLVVIHTAEGATTSAELGAYFANPATQVSSHVGIDDTSTIQYVDYSNEAWTILSANPISDNAELCGFAAWTREQWLGQHMPMLTATAAWIAQRCTARGIPIVKLTPAQVAAGQAGVIGHVDWTIGMHDGTHQDPGDGFPWDIVIGLAQQHNTPTPSPAPPAQEDVMSPIELTFYNDTWQPDPAGLNFRGSCPAESGTGSAVIDTMWVRWVAYWGICTWKIVAWDSAKPIGQAPSGGDWWQIPAAARGFTVEGRRNDPGVQPAASIVVKTK